MTDVLPDLIPQVVGILVRRGLDRAAAEDAVQEAAIEALRRWPEQQPDDPLGWLVTVAGRQSVDAQRSDAARHRREERLQQEPASGPTEVDDDTLLLLSRCCHPSLSMASAIALTLRSVGGLTTRQIADAFMVPESTMAQRISRAKRTVREARFDQPGDVTAVLRVLYLIFNEGYTGEVDLAVEAIRLTRQLAAGSDDPEIAGLLALMLLHHARRAARLTPDGEIVPLAEQDRSRWDTAMITEGVGILQRTLARDRLGEYQAQAAIAALHDDAAHAGETDWPQIASWYDELLRFSGGMVVLLNRAVAIGEADGPQAGLTALDGVAAGTPRRDAVAAHLHERAGDLATAATLYSTAARAATNQAEMFHLTKQAARLNRILAENPHSDRHLCRRTWFQPQHRTTEF